MKLFVTALNSGSNGNCYYVGNEREAVLIDAGISCRETEQRMKRLGLNIRKVKAIFITHEHSDHIRGVDRISKKYEIPVYITSDTLMNSRLDLKNPFYCRIRSGDSISIGELKITSFAKYHDAEDPQSFVVETESLCIGVFTDIGEACKNVIRYFKCCHAVFLESNYDEEMLDRGSYPYHLKQRIKGRNGHLSNAQALDLFLAHKPPFMSHLFLSHISKENNQPELAHRLFNKVAENVKIILTSREEEIPVYEISSSKVSEGQLTLHF